MSMLHSSRINTRSSLLLQRNAPPEPRFTPQVPAKYCWLTNLDSRPKNNAPCTSLAPLRETSKQVVELRQQWDRQTIAYVSPLRFGQHPFLDMSETPDFHAGTSPQFK